MSGLEAAWNQEYIYDTKTNNTTPGADDNASSTGGTKTPTAAIVGGTVGGVAAGVLLLGGFLFMRRRKKQKAAAAAEVAPPQPPMDNVVRDAGPYTGPCDIAGAYNRDSVYSTAPPNYGSKSPAPTYTAPVFPNLEEAPQEVHGESTSPTSIAHELPGDDATR